MTIDSARNAGVEVRVARAANAWSSKAVARGETGFHVSGVRFERRWPRNERMCIIWFSNVALRGRFVGWARLNAWNCVSRGVQMNTDAAIGAAVDLIRDADALLIGAGAGMGVDSGLPDFRGPAGFWKAYPAFRGKQFAEISTPHWFETDPELAWGFFGHRLSLYRHATPHAGFDCLRRWTAGLRGGHFIFTSNVDGQFQKAEFSEDHVLECHGSIHHLQCARNCGHGIWSADKIEIEVDEATTRAVSTLPTCPRCQSLARPNILMFGDWKWDSARSRRQTALYRAWLARVQNLNVVAIELGAGTAIPTVRDECTQRGRSLVRINPDESKVATAEIALPMRALAALQLIDARLC